MVLSWYLRPTKSHQSILFLSLNDVCIELGCINVWRLYNYDWFQYWCKRLVIENYELEEYYHPFYLTLTNPAPGIKTSRHVSLYVLAMSQVWVNWNTERRLGGALPRRQVLLNCCNDVSRGSNNDFPSVRLQYV